MQATHPATAAVPHRPAAHPQRRPAAATAAAVVPAGRNPGRGAPARGASHHHHQGGKAKSSLSQKELSVVVMLLAAETAVVTSRHHLGDDGLPAALTQQQQVAAIDEAFASATPPAWVVRLHSLPHPKLDPMTISAAQSFFAPDGTDGLTPAARKLVASYLPWRDGLALRCVSKSWNSAAAETVIVASLPSRPDVRAVFCPCPVNVDQDGATEERLRCRHPSKWRCQYCGFVNSECRVLCGNRHCQVPCPSHRDCARLFLGQLRREGTVPFLRWLVEDVILAPSAASSAHDDSWWATRIVNAENHRQLSTGRGKGCAWIYLAGREGADAVLRYHHRVFADVHPVTKREGVWIVKGGSEDALAADVAARAAFDAHRSLILPRGALVVEFPSRQALPFLPPPQQQLHSDAAETTSIGMAAASVAGPSSMSMSELGADASCLPPPPPYHWTFPAGPAAACAGRSGTATPPEGAWLPSTDSPPSESASDNEKPSPSSPTGAQPSAAPTTSTGLRRHEPYRSPALAGMAADFAAASTSSGTPTPVEWQYDGYSASGSAAGTPPMMGWRHYGSGGGHTGYGGYGGRRHNHHNGYSAHQHPHGVSPYYHHQHHQFGFEEQGYTYAVGAGYPTSQYPEPQCA